MLGMMLLLLLLLLPPHEAHTRRFDAGLTLDIKKGIFMKDLCCGWDFRVSGKDAIMSLNLGRGIEGGTD